MAFVENCVERAVGLAAACGWLVMGGGVEAAVGVTIGGAGFAAVVCDIIRRQGPESEAALKSIRARISKDLHSHATAERWDNRADLEAADEAMERALTGCFLDRQALAAAARSKEGFPNVASELILAALAQREPTVFGSAGSPAALDYAGLVVTTALKAALENEAYFRRLEPHLVMEALRGIGVIEVKLEAIHGDVLKILEMLSPKRGRSSVACVVGSMKIDLVTTEDGDCYIFHNIPFPYDLDHVELDWKNRRFSLVLPGDFKKTLRDPVPLHMVDNLAQNDGRVMVVLMSETTGQAIEGYFFPLRILERPQQGAADTTSSTGAGG